MKTYVGIDVAKKTFDLNFSGNKKVYHFKYDQAGIEKCIEQLTKNQVVLVVLEATGGYERQLLVALKSADLPVARVNPRKVRDFARAQGITAKTDAIDARVIADYAALFQPPQADTQDDNSLKLKDLVARRKQLIAMRVAENNRVEHAYNQSVRQSIQQMIETINEQIARLDKEIDDTIDSTPQLKRKAEIIQSVTGLGQKTSSMLIAEMPELGHCTRGQIAALTGTAPMNRDSGQLRGKRMTGGGRTQVRTGMFMATLVAVQHNQKLKNFYQRLLENGKAKMTALIAVMRKLLVILNAMIRKNQLWNEHLSKNLS